MKENITIGEKYSPAMEIKTQDEADEYFDVLVRHSMEHFGKNRKEAEQLERINLGYYAGYYSRETSARVQQLFRCVHPIFGSIEEFPTPEEAFEMGKKMEED